MAIQVIVVDDDPIVGTLTYELIQEVGFSVKLLSESLRAEEEIRREKPALVVLDILMPGIDGLTLLHRLKSDPETAKTRVIIVSGKSFESDKTRALQYGAEMFLEKPYDVETFGAKVTEIMKASGAEPAQITPAPSAPAPVGRTELTVAVWGSRSGATAESTADSRYGRRTSCVCVELPKHLIVFDAGSGLSALGNDLVKSGRFKELWLFLTHFHHDHVEGLADFACARDASYTLNISGASDPDKPFEEALTAALEPAFDGKAPPCRIELYELMEQTYEILPGVRMTALFANHPGTTLGYILQSEGRKIAYCPDSELYGEYGTALQDYDEKLGGMVRDADLLIHDGCFTEEDYKNNRNAGHSSFLAAVDFAVRNKVKSLLLFHQNGRYGDDVLDKMAKDAEARVAEKGSDLKVQVAREGLRLAV